jgi:hypothetical protein
MRRPLGQRRGLPVESSDMRAPVASKNKSKSSSDADNDPDNQVTIACILDWRVKAARSIDATTRVFVRIHGAPLASLSQQWRPAISRLLPCLKTLQQRHGPLLGHFCRSLNENVRRAALIKFCAERNLADGNETSANIYANTVIANSVWRVH